MDSDSLFSCKLFNLFITYKIRVCSEALSYLLNLFLFLFSFELKAALHRFVGLEMHKNFQYPEGQTLNKNP